MAVTSGTWQAARWLLALALLPLETSASGQSDPPLETIPAEFYAPDQDAVAFFDSLEERDPDDGPPPELEAIDLGEAGATLDAEIETYYRRSARADGWDDTPIRLIELLGRTAEQSGRSMLHGRGMSGPTTMFLGSRAPNEAVPSNWIEIPGFGAAGSPDGIRLVQAGYVSPKLAIVSVSEPQTRGTAICLQNTRHRIFMRPDVAASQVDTMAYLILQRTVRASPDLCVSVVGAPDGYRLRYHDAQGYRLAKFESLSPVFRFGPFEALDRLGPYQESPSAVLPPEG